MGAEFIYLFIYLYKLGERGVAHKNSVVYFTFSGEVCNYTNV